ncbi:glycosyl transferase [Oligella sp. HMSC05A10]|uniref:MraY family glycosyltransferase n=1 Tax=Oligella sp. HMSC05A10 TaxID=1581112 RepID=UPI0008A198BB|nr:glycosyltransferase family 4 protein [Oligella sp. HMSC05A10]OFS87261.1 glycosyl transferase [Oligella sp. HMSC05A10]
MNPWFLVFPLVLLASFLLTGALRQYAIKRSVIDIPNERSSHSVPTPRGGGVAIVISFLLTLLILYFLDLLSASVMLGLLGGGLTIAVLGFLDDHGHIAPRWRLLGHFSAAIWVLYWIGGIAPINIFGVNEINLLWIGHILAGFYVVWLLNLYNFMDGIDGIASIEAVSTCVSIAVIYTLLGHLPEVYLPLVLAFAVGGFLLWNFPPAKIFMGDAGSGFLGFILAALSLHAAWLEPNLLWSWIILLGVFIVDATYTLFRRLLRGEKVYEAHRSHAYQYASRHLKGHRPVTLAVLAINVLWLFPLALLVALNYLDGIVGIVIAFMPLMFLAVKFKAGEKEEL